MTETLLKHNRPVHLARMLSCYERAMDLVFQPITDAGPRVRMRQADVIAALLDKAAKHAKFCILSAPSLPEENAFYHFLKLSRQSAVAIRSMLQNEVELKAEEGFITQFLMGEDDECALSAMHYQRRSEDSIQGLSHMMRLAQHPYCQMKQKVLESMSNEDLDRFNRANEDVAHHFQPSKGSAVQQNLPIENVSVA